MATGALPVPGLTGKLTKGKVSITCMPDYKTGLKHSNYRREPSNID